MARLTIYDRNGNSKFATSGRRGLLGAESSSLVITENGGFYILLEDGSKVTGKFKYVGQTMAVSYLEFTIASPYPIDWNVGDYVDYGEGILGDADTRFMLFTIPQPKKDAESGLYGGAFVYSGMQFHDCGQILSLAPFTDMQVENDNLIHYSTRDGLSTFENVAGITARLQACADAYRLSLADDNPMKGTKFYFVLCTSDSTAYERTVEPDNTEGGEDIEVYEELIDEARAVTIDGSVLDGMNNIQSVWPAIGWGIEFLTCEWVYDYDSHGRILYATELNTIQHFDYSYRSEASTVPSSIKDEYGQECGTLPVRFAFVKIGGVNFVGNAGASDQFARHAGLVNLRRYVTNQNEFLTRLVAYGSERNIPGRYYNGKEIYNADSVDIPNLMIPLSEWGKTYGRVHDSVFNIDYETTENPDGSIAYAVAVYNNITHEYFYTYNATNHTYTVKDKTGAVVATGSYSSSNYPGTDILPQTYQEPLKLLPDARKAYIENDTIVARYGVITKSVRFDNDNDGDIYPSITGMTLQDIRECVGISTEKPTSDHPTDGLYVRRNGNDWLSDINGIAYDTKQEIKADSSYRVMLLRYGYARRGQWFPAKGSGSEIRRQNPRPDGESTHTTRRCPNVNSIRLMRESEPANYQLVRRGYSNGLPALRYRVIGWDILIHGGMPEHSQLTKNMGNGGVFKDATIATRLGADLKLPRIKKCDIHRNKQTGVTYYRHSKKNGVTDLYIGLYHYENEKGWVLVSNVVQVRGRVSIPGGYDSRKVWFGDESNIVYGG